MASRPEENKGNSNQKMEDVSKPDQSIRKPNQRIKIVPKPEESNRKQVIKLREPRGPSTNNNSSGARPKMRSYKPTNITRDSTNSNRDSSEPKYKGFVNSERKYPMGYKHLKELETKTPGEVMFTIQTSHSGFKILLNEPELDKEKLSMCLRVISLACRCELTEPLKNLLEDIIKECESFLNVKLARYLLDTQSSVSNAYKLQSLYCIVDLTEALQTYQPELSLLTTQTLLPYARIAIARVTQELGTGYELLARVEDQEAKMKDLLKTYNTVRSMNRKDVVPDNFRNIPIFPDRNDLISNKRPFLRPNIVEGRYCDVNHYLDVQFRLLREDFIRPLREGVSSYVENLKNENYKRPQDIKVYEGVRIMQSTLSNDGIGHLVQFNVGALRNVDWKETKRLIGGALVCLTPDHFETIYFGTVARRKDDEHELAKGKVEIQFEKHADMLNVETLTFTMIETEAYFEAFRHVLTALQNIDENTFPLKEHIVELRKNIDCPEYINDETVYCFGKLIAEPIGSLPMEDQIDAQVPIRSEATLKHNIHCKNQRLVTIIKDETWPTAKEMNLDESQYLAFKSALRHKISIIQGPPGTGKTHVGLKIMRALLHNSNIWNETSSSPILIVCYTNHALDQFLEGVLKLTTNIIRVGGRCKSEELKPYNLNELKKRRGHLQQQFDSTKKEIASIVHQIKQKEELLNKAYTLLLTEIDLQTVMEKHHYRNLVEEIPFYFKDIKMGMILKNWLKLNDAENKKPEKGVSNPTKRNITNPQAKAQSEERETHYAHDIEFIMDQRYDEDDSDSNQRVVLFDQSQQLHDNLDQRNVNIIRKLKNCRPFNDKDLRQRNNIWNMKIDDRWRLYKTWVERLVEQTGPEIEDLKMAYERKVITLHEIRKLQDANICKSALVIGMTTTGAAKYRHLVSSIKSKIVIVEEAAEVLEAHIVTSLSKETRHLILIGDHQQLRPNPTVYDLAKKFNLEISLFERLIKNGMPYVRLGNQHRMKPDISRLLVPHIYKDLEDHPSVFNYEEILGFNKSVYFVTHDQHEIQERDSTTRVNIHEAQLIVNLCRHILLQGYHPSKVTILTTYTGQLYEIKRLLSGQLEYVRAAVVDNYQGEENDIILLSFVRSNDLRSIGFLKTENRVCVALSRAKKGLFCIGNFHLFAQESTLWSNILNELTQMSAIGPSLDLRCQLHKTSIIVSRSFNFNDVPDGGCALPCDYRLDCGHVCPKRCHPIDREHEMVKCPKACERLCNLGHKCPNICSDDCWDCMVKVSKTVPKCGHDSIMACYEDVGDYNCKHACPKVFECGHSCPQLCYEECEPCEVLVSKTLPRCEHETELKCSTDVNSYKCKIPCEKSLPCGHQCPKRCGNTCGGCQVVVNVIGSCQHTISIECHNSNHQESLLRACRVECTDMLECGHKCDMKCGDDCQKKCKVEVEVKSPCGHVIKSPCYLSKDEKYMLESCPVKCEKVLKCGHPCGGTCAGCFQGRFHATCQTKCNKILICGHACQSLCSSSCPPCRRPCENRCQHSQCPQTCGYPCAPCQENCRWQCEHLKCSKRCSQPCNRSPCERPCTKSLRCRHPCVGMCGEPCPRLCRFCNKEELETIFFGNEDDPKARFLQLEDCNHVIEIKGLTKWVQEASSGEIKMITCPVCKTPIRKNSRFGKEVNRDLERIELVKQKIFGQFNENRQLQKNIKVDIVQNQRFSRLSIFESKFYEGKTQRLLETIDYCIPPSGQGVLPRGTLITMQNNVSILKALRQIESLFYKALFTIKTLPGKALEEYAKLSGTKIISIMEQTQYDTPQVVVDVSLEIRRLQWMSNFYHDFATSFRNDDKRVKASIEEITKQLIACKPFTENDFITLDSLKDNLKKISGPMNFDVSHGEKLQIVEAMGPTQGHWYSCPNGHVYCVTECGRPTMEGRCNECRSAIGGLSHNLRADNRPVNIVTRSGVPTRTSFNLNRRQHQSRF